MFKELSSRISKESLLRRASTNVRDPKGIDKQILDEDIININLKRRFL